MSWFDYQIYEGITVGNLPPFDIMVVAAVIVVRLLRNPSGRPSMK